MGNNNELINIAPVKKYMPEEIRAIRLKIGLTQDGFGKYLGVSRATIEAWEYGRFSPSGTGHRLLAILDKDPQFPYTSGIIKNE